jgi:hypothetical protein
MSYGQSPCTLATFLFSEGVVVFCLGKVPTAKESEYGHSGTMQLRYLHS